MRLSCMHLYNLRPLIIIILFDIHHAMPPISRQINVSCCQGEDAHFSWFEQPVEESSVTQIVWTREPKEYLSVWDGNKFSDGSERYRDRVIPFTNGTLILKSCQFADSGNYSVEIDSEDSATKKIIKRIAIADLRVQDWEAPFRKPLVVKQKTDVDPCQEFRCFEDLYYLGKPSVRFEWKSNGEIINGSRRGNYGYLVVCPSNQTGDYSCRLTGDAVSCLHPGDPLSAPVVFNITVSTKPVYQSSTTVGVAVSLVIGIIFLVAAAILLVIWWRRRRKDQQNYNTKIAEKEKLSSEETQRLQEDTNPEA